MTDFVDEKPNLPKAWICLLDQPIDNGLQPRWIVKAGNAKSEVLPRQNVMLLIG